MQRRGRNGGGSPVARGSQRAKTPRRANGHTPKKSRRVVSPALTQALERAEQEKARVPLASLSPEDHDWSAVLELVSDQARAIKECVGVSNKLDARLQAVEAWQNEQVSLGRGAGGAPGGWTSKDIEAADDWQAALAGINERMGKVGSAFGQFVQTNASRVEKIESQLDGAVASRLAALEQRLADTFASSRCESTAQPDEQAAVASDAVVSWAEKPAGQLTSAVASRLATLEERLDDMSTESGRDNTARPEQLAIASEAVVDRMRNEMVDALDQLEQDLENRLSTVAAQERAFATSHVEKVQASVAELNKRLTSEMVNLAASVAWPVKKQSGQLDELASRADDIDARVQVNEQYATATQVEALVVRMDKLQEWSEAASGKLTGQKKTVRAVASGLTDLTAKVAREATQRSESEAKAGKRAELVEKAINAIRADIKGLKGTKRRTHQEAAPTDSSKGSVGQSEWTKWVSEQAATVTSLEERLAADITQLKEGMKRVAAVEEGLGDMNARMASSSSSVEGRLAEFAEQAAQERTAAAESMSAEMSELKSSVVKSAEHAQGHLQEQIESQSKRCTELEDRAAERDDANSSIFESLRQEIKALQDAALRSHQEALAVIDANGDGKIDQSEWTKWVSEQAATVTSLEERLAADITKLKEGMKRVAAVEEGLGDMNARMASSSSSVEGRLAEFAEQAAQERTAAREAVDRFGAELAAAQSQHQAAAERIDGVSTRLDSVNSIAEALRQTVDMAISEASEIEKAVAVQAKGWERLRQTEVTVREQASRVDALEKRLDTALDEAHSTTEEVSSTDGEQVASMEAKLSELDDLVKTAASSLELEAKAKELSDAMSSSETQVQQMQVAVSGCATGMSDLGEEVAGMKKDLSDMMETLHEGLAQLREEMRGVEAEVKAAAAKMDAEAQAAAAGKAVKESEASSGAMSLKEQASRVDALEQRFETALDASKATTAEVLSTVSSTFEGKLTSLEAKLSRLEDVIKTAASSSELEVMAKGLSDSMSTSVAGLQSKVVDLVLQAAESSADTLRAELQANIDQSAEASSASVAALKEEIAAYASAVASMKEQLVSQINSNGAVHPASGTAADQLEVAVGHPMTSPEKPMVPQVEPQAVPKDEDPALPQTVPPAVPDTAPPAVPAAAPPPIPDSAPPPVPDSDPRAADVRLAASTGDGSPVVGAAPLSEEGSDLSSDVESAGTRTVEIAVPEGHSGGDSFTIELPDGQEIDVEVPDGLIAGDVFEIELEDDAPGTAQSEQRETVTETQAPGVQIMTVEVVCPWDSGPGDVIDVPRPGSSGLSDEEETAVEVTVPEGVHAGQAFEVQIPAPTQERESNSHEDAPNLQQIAEQLAEWQNETEQGIIKCLGEFVQQADFRLVEQVKQCLLMIAEAEVDAETKGSMTGGWWAQTLRQKFGFALCAEPQLVQALEKRADSVEQRLSTIESGTKASEKQLVDVGVSLAKTSKVTSSVRESHEQLTGTVNLLQRGLNNTIQQEVDDRIGTVIGRTKGDMKKEVSRLEAKLVGRLRKATAESVAKHSQLEEELWAKTAQLTQLLQAQQASGDDSNAGATGSGGVSPKELKRMEAKLSQKLKANDDKYSTRLAALEPKVEALEAKLFSPA